MTAYWPWWVGAIALGIITATYPMVVGRRFGVSSAWDRTVHWSREREAERLDDSAFGADESFEMLLAAATAAEFGSAPTSALPAPLPLGADVGLADSGGPLAKAPPLRRLPMIANVTLLASILIGALAVAIVAGRFDLRADLGPAFADIVVDGPLMWPTLFFGGLLVGFGARMGGGCSSGHGLSGCSSVQPVSLLATTVFFGAAVAVSSLLYWII